jgi:hypothetical protein
MEFQAASKTAQADAKNQPAVGAKANPPESIHLFRELHRLFGNRAVGLHIQAKLKVSSPGDAYEQEADRVADQVMRQIDRTEPVVQMKPSASAAAGGEAAPAVVHDVLHSPGQPLDTSARTSFERRLGQSFEDVRIHVDEHAAASAEAVGARAYTVGNHIVFGDGEFNPHVHEGQRLLLHELVHTIQMVTGGMSHRLARTPANHCTAARDAAMAREIAMVADDVDHSLFVLRGRLMNPRPWWFTQEEDDRIDFFFECPSDARVREIIADLERLHRSLTPSFRYRCGSRRSRTRTMEFVFTPEFGLVPTGLIVRGSDFSDLPFLRTQILGVGLRLIGLSHSGLVPYFHYVHMDVHSTPACRPVERHVPPPPPPEMRVTHLRCDGLADAPVYVTRAGASGPVVGWDQEPRRAVPESGQGEWRSHGEEGYAPVALGHLYTWQCDVSTQRAYITVDGQRWDLLENGAVELHR